MKEKWAKVKEFFSRPKVIKWTVIILTIVIFIGAVKALIWTIYTKDQPAFVPENVREDIQGAIKEGGETIKKVSEPIGTAIVDAGFVRESDSSDSNDAATDPTKNWPTYTDKETGISFKYPEGWTYLPGDLGVFTFAPDENSYDYITFYTSNTAEGIDPYWSDYVKDGTGVFSSPEVVKLGAHNYTVYRQQDGMREVHYLLERDGVIYDILPGGEGFSYVEDMLATIN